MSESRKPSNYIQWKGTDVCMDFYCQCGVQSHIDDDFTYYVQCPACGQIYKMGDEVSMTPVDSLPKEVHPSACKVGETSEMRVLKMKAG